MIVAKILAHKGRDVFTTGTEMSVADAVRLLGAHRIGALVVVDAARRILGILSERDIVRTLAASGAAALDQPVRAVMTEKVVTCSENDTINEVMARMTKGRFRHLPVVENDLLVGLVSIGDVVKARIEAVEREADEMRAYIATA
ncbi:CBS domain-containing protein [Prosthecomicrobium pneumaticum]|uniref:CBS domain-containing protein n=1 Tax=Prosthecomicrobium pneumaticum TaxID=81895 RepID=A0A7W9FPI2_9HYPH|nr:CBS domain-containing protein [Prosthecomicrobium pneumaticum]MBB5754412.1 CBS domain-containing protein [Prosthecomicrobium pneumaticum]